jgi:peroxiredoxin
MKKLLAIIILLSLSLHAQMLTFKTLKNEYIQIQNDAGVFNFVNLKYHNKDTLLFFFGSDCPHCTNEIPQIKQLANNKNIQLIGIHAQADIGDNALKSYIKKTGYNFDVLSFSDDIKLINHLKERDMWSGEVPFHILVDKQGNLRTVELSEVLGKF